MSENQTLTITRGKLTGINDKRKLLNDISLMLTSNSIIVIDDEKDDDIKGFYVRNKLLTNPSLRDHHNLSNFKILNKNIFLVKNKIINKKTVIYVEFII